MRELNILEFKRKIAGILHGPLRMIGYEDRFPGNCVLTFDDGPNENTIRVLDALKEGKVHKATFCVKGSNVKKYPQVLRRIVDDGHMLANHTYDHLDLRELTGRRIVQQLRMCREAVNDALGRKYRLTQMRPPYGFFNDQVLTTLHFQRLDILLWQVDAKDFLPENQANPDNIIRRVLPEAVKHGGLLLFHDVHKTTADIIPVIIQLLISNGIKFTSVKELLDTKYPSSRLR